MHQPCNHADDIVASSGHTQVLPCLQSTATHASAQLQESLQYDTSWLSCLLRSVLCVWGAECRGGAPRAQVLTAFPPACSDSCCDCLTRHQTAHSKNTAQPAHLFWISRLFLALFASLFSSSAFKVPLCSNDCSAASSFFFCGSAGSPTTRQQQSRVSHS